MGPVVLVALEVVFVALIVAGVAMMHVPAALILAGVLGVLAVERASTPHAAVRRGVRS